MTVERLSPEDAAILALEEGNVRGHTVKVLVLEAGGGAPPPDVDRLRTHVGARLHLAPRLRQRLLATPLGIAPPVWADDPGFDLSRHIVAATPPAPMPYAELPDIVADLMRERLDRAHPLWRIDVIERLEDGATALIWRLHHAMADGVVALRIAAAVLWDTRPDAPVPPPAAWHPAPAPGRARLLGSGIAARTRAGVRRLSSMPYGLPSFRRWRGTMRGLPRVEAVVRRELAPAADETALDHRAGTARSVAFASVELAELKRIGKGFGEGITVNDVVLAAVTGGIRDWLDRRGQGAGRMRVQVPVSLHQHLEEPDAAGNRDSYFFAELPIGEPDPVARLLAVNAQTSDRKRRSDAEVLYHLPLRGALDRWGMSPHVFTFNVSNVPGPRAPVYVAGARLRELYSLAEIAEHHALRIAAVSASGRLFVGICADRDAVDEIDTLARGLRRTLDELDARLPTR